MYGGIIWLRNRLYDTGVFSCVEFDLPVISVGNLSTGGTGKTPHVEYLIQLLQYRYKIATLSRGYKRQSQGFLVANAQSDALQIGDEPMQYHRKFRDLVVCVAEERITGIPTLLYQHPEIDVILLDDAYQHRSVKPGLNILITDYSHLYYNDFILPFGNLRENRKASGRADIIIVSKCPTDIDIQEANAIIRKLNKKERQQVFFSTIEYGAPFNMFDYEKQTISGMNVVLVCGIAKPESLISYLKPMVAGIHILNYKDHHLFTENDVVEIKEAYENWQVTDKIVLTTEKDATRLLLHAKLLAATKIPFWVMPIKIKMLLDGETEFDSIVFNYVEKNATSNTIPE